MPHGRVLGRFQVVFTKSRDWEFAGSIGHEVAGAEIAGQGLLVNFCLERHESMEQGFRAGGTAGDMDIDGNKPVDALEDVVALFERAA